MSDFLSMDLLHGFIALLVPMVIALLKRVVDSLPPRWLPLLAAVLGTIADALVALSTGGEINPQLGVAAGLLGVGLREFLVKLTLGSKPNKMV